MHAHLVSVGEAAQQLDVVSVRREEHPAHVRGRGRAGERRRRRGAGACGRRALRRQGRRRRRRARRTPARVRLAQQRRAQRHVPRESPAPRARLSASQPRAVDDRRVPATDTSASSSWRTIVRGPLALESVSLARYSRAAVLQPGVVVGRVSVQHEVRAEPPRLLALLARAPHHHLRARASCSGTRVPLPVPICTTSGPPPRGCCHVVTL